MLLGSIEAGGTKFVCAVGNEDYRIMDSTKFPTTTPAETLQKCIDYFKQFNDLQAISIASFGPIEIRRNSPKYGYITNTPKPGWADTDFVGTLKKAFNVPIAWTTDVNGIWRIRLVNAVQPAAALFSLLYDWNRCWWRRGCGWSFSWRSRTPGNGTHSRKAASR